MPALPVRQDHHARPQLAQHANDLQPILEGVLHPAIRQIERLPPANSQDARCSFGFRGTLCSGAAGPRLALRQVQDAGLQAKRAHLEQRAAAGLLHIVAMRGNGQNVYDAVCG